jgi:uncharacterized MAPEG superfamily protein
MYAITAIVLALKMAAISFVQGRARLSTKSFLNPEDAAAFGGVAVEQEGPVVQRAARAWRNDVENIPIFLIIAWIYVGAVLAFWPFVVYCSVFMAARIAHTYCYINEIQPMRTFAFTIGALAMLAMMVHIFVAVVI